ncbi:MAG: histidine kinase [Pseudomonadota bacterium]
MSFLTRPFRIKPTVREAVQYTLPVWLTGFLFMAVITAMRPEVSGAGDWTAMTMGLISALIVAMLLYQAFRLAADRPAWLAYVIVVVAVGACAALQGIADYAGQYFVASLTPGMLKPPLDMWAFTITAFFYVCLYSANAALLWISFANRVAREQATRLAEATAEAARAELRALRLQLNPHFLFNSLNAVGNLIAAGRSEEARTTVQNLAGFLRGSLSEAPDGKIELADEFDTACAYLEVETVRFPDRLDVEVSCPDDLRDALVPDFLLQPIVENTVRYALSGASEPVSLRMAARRDGEELVLRVEDDGVRGATTGGGLGIGQANTTERLKVMYGGRAAMTAGPQTRGYAVEIRLPLEFVA